MLQQLNKKRKGAFTLVEIMIVVAIIALLAAMAIPNLVRARQRTQATTIKEELRLIESAKQQWATETNQSGTATPQWTDLTKYFKQDSDLARRDSETDLLGNSISLGTINTSPKVSADTKAEFAEVVDDQFWGAYDPDLNASGAGGAGGAGGGSGGE